MRSAPVQQEPSRQGSGARHLHTGTAAITVNRGLSVSRRMHSAGSIRTRIRGHQCVARLSSHAATRPGEGGMPRGSEPGRGCRQRGAARAPRRAAHRDAARFRRHPRRARGATSGSAGASRPGTSRRRPRRPGARGAQGGRCSARLLARPKRRARSFAGQRRALGRSRRASLEPQEQLLQARGESVLVRLGAPGGERGAESGGHLSWCYPQHQWALRGWLWVGWRGSHCGEFRGLGGFGWGGFGGCRRFETSIAHSGIT